ncbi:MAG TPA: MMPL family transporter, partial [Crenalkalicoccus sp.]|nr:MMPL family transporter [Crenalkalicoccus sp.]
MRREAPFHRLAVLGAALVQRSVAHHRAVLAAAAVLLLLAIGTVTHRFAMDTDVTNLFPQDLPWRETERALARAFPGREDLIAVVIDGATPGIADRAAAELAQTLRGNPGLFHRVERPDTLPFLRRSALLFLPLPEVRETTERIVMAQPLLGTLAADPSLRGLARTFDLVLQGVEQGESSLDMIEGPLDILADSAEAAIAGRTRFVDWATLFTGRESGTRERRRFVLVQPVLDYTALSPGAAAEQAVRDAAARLNLTPAHGVRVRLTGQIPMADEEFATVSQGAVTNTTLSLALVSLLLWLALRSLTLILPVLVTLIVGLAVTCAFGLLVIGPFNPLSIAFAVLFIGLGVDFGIQYAVRAREQLHRTPVLPEALAAAGGTAGPGIILAALAVAGSFLSFLPTEYRGVSELGAIAGCGMIVAGLLSLTVLPALLMVTEPAPEPAEIGWRQLAPIEVWLTRHARQISTGSLVLGLAALATLPWLPFDFNPLHLRDPKTEAVATFLELMRDKDTTPNTVDVLAPSLAQAQTLARRLEALPEVSEVLTLESFVPADQEPKLALIRDAADLIGPTLSPPEVAPPPSDAEVAQQLGALADAL